MSDMEKIKKQRAWCMMTEEERVVKQCEKYKEELAENAKCEHKNLKPVIYNCRYEGPKVSGTFGYTSDRIIVGINIVCDDCGKSWDSTQTEATIL